MHNITTNVNLRLTLSRRRRLFPRAVRVETAGASGFGLNEAARAVATGAKCDFSFDTLDVASYFGGDSFGANAVRISWGMLPACLRLVKREVACAT